MDIDDQSQIMDITNHVVDLRNSDLFIPTDMSSSQSNYDDDTSSASQPNQNQQHIAYLIVDTNFILSHLKLLDDLERLLHEKYMGAYQIVIPKQVIHELDGLKDSDRSTIESKHSMSTLARESINWCYLHFYESVPTITGQRLHERIDKNATKDNAILDCCLYFQNVENGGSNMVVLLSNDKNLCNKALVNNILTISYRPQMTADLIANNVVSELINSYNFNYNNENINPNANSNYTSIYNHDGMGIEMEMENETQIPTQKHHILNAQPSPPPPSAQQQHQTLNDVSYEIYNQVTTLVLEAIKYAVDSIFGDDTDMVGYNDYKMRTLTDASRCIVKLGVSTFSDFFDRRRFNPMKILQDRDQQRLFINQPENKSTLLEFITFWSEFLEGIYKNRESNQKDALNQIIKHWENLAKSVEI